MKIRLVGAKLFHADGWMDGRSDGRTDGRTHLTNLVVAFRNFVKSA